MDYLVIGIIIFILVYSVSLYNKLVSLRNRFKNAFSQIDVQLTRRYELIPNLVETTKAYMKHEQETLEKVIAARNQAVSAAKGAASDPTSSSQLKNLMGAEAALTGAMGHMFALMENYPDLKADQTMGQLMEELSSSENKVAFARQAFNDAVMVYNTCREQFPSNFVANFFNFAPAQLFEMEDEAARKPIKVSFD